MKSQLTQRLGRDSAGHPAMAFEVRHRTFRRKFELIAVQGHPRSSILVPIESPYASLISSNFVSRTVMTRKVRK